MGFFDTLPPGEFDSYAAAHLLWRAGFGCTFDEAEAASHAGLAATVERLLDFPSKPLPPPPAIAESGVESDLAFRERLRSATPEERLRRLAMRRRDERERIGELKLWWLQRMHAGECPLQEKLTLFWHSHFASGFEDKIERALPMWNQNDLFRRMALAPFPDLLRAVLKDPAMLVWLDNANSHRGSPNENLARELMELFSLGVGHYTETDVKEAARALTGYSTDRETWAFVFRPDAHDDGEKTFLGRTGAFDADALAAILCEEDACSRFMAHKMLSFFAGDDPADDAVEEGARLLRVLGFEWKPWLETLFKSRWFYSPATRESVVKSPVVLALGALRSMRVPIPPGDALPQLLRLMGQDLFFPPDVNGWPGGATWINSNTLLIRYNFSNWLLNGVSPEQFRVFDRTTAPDARRREFIRAQRADNAIEWSPRKTLAQTGADRKLATGADIVDHYLREFLGRVPPASLRSQMLAFAETDASGGRRSFSLNDTRFDEAVRGLVHLLMSSPEYQLC